MKKTYYFLIQMLLITFIVNVEINAQTLSPLESRSKGEKAADFLLPDTDNSVQAKPSADRSADLPYFENFDNYEERDIPTGWLLPGDKPFVLRHFYGWKDIYSEPYCLAITSSSTGNEPKWAFSPGFNMEAGETYHISFWLLAPGLSTGQKESLKVTVGAEQTVESQVTILADLPQITYKDWKKVKVEYSPTVSGVYHFGITLLMPIINGVGIDDFEVYSENNPFPVEAKYRTEGGIWSVNASNMEKHVRYIYKDQPIVFVNESKNATTYSWENTFGIPATSVEENPTINYSQSGMYEPVLEASNKKYSDTYKDIVNVVVVGGEEDVTDIVANYGMYDKLYEPETYLPSANDFVSGINRYYTTFAERYEMPEGAKASISAVSLKLNLYKASTSTKSKPLRVKIYGEKWGVPDPDNVFGVHETTVRGAFGDASIDYESVAKTITFAQPISTTGPFFVSIELDESIKPDATNKLSLSFDLYRTDKVTSAFAYVHASGASELNISEGWYSLIDLPEPFTELDKTGFSFYLCPTITFLKDGGSSVEAASKNKVKVYPTVFDQVLNIEFEDNTAEQVIVYNVNGQKVYESVLSNKNSLIIPSSGWNSGIYFVNVIGSATNFSTKVMKL